jgi:peptidyl-prolyl cis-trans isomerase A (cyclophilin A)
MMPAARPARGLRLTMHAAAAAVLLLLAAACGRDGPEGAAGEGAVTVPDTFRVAFETSRGPFVVEAIRAWAPNGADRFHALARSGFFDEARFFRVVPDFIAQFGLNGDRRTNERWAKRPIPDDTARQSNVRGTLVFTSTGPNTRSHQMFVNLVDNTQLDAQGFAPFGRVVEGMAVVDSLYGGYGEEPSQHLIIRLGNSYLTRMFPKLDYIRTARVAGAAAP